jgi:hypothetical protein
LMTNHVPIRTYQIVIRLRIWFSKIRWEFAQSNKLANHNKNKY